MENLKKIYLLLLILIAGFAISSCGGGGGDSGIAITGRIVNEASDVLPTGQFSILGSGVVGNITALGWFTAQTTNPSGVLILVNQASGFRFRRVPFDTAGGGSLNLGDITLSNDALSRGWGEYAAGNLANAEAEFKAHINSSGRDLMDARNGLGWALARLGKIDEGFPYLLEAADSNLEAEARTALTMSHLMKTLRGEYSIPQAISNLDLAIADSGFYLSKPLHDDISEDDLTAFRAMLNIIDGRIANATSDRNTVMGNDNAMLNAASRDLLEVVDFFLSQ